MFAVYAEELQSKCRHKAIRFNQVAGSNREGKGRNGKTCDCSEQRGFAGANGAHDDGERGRQRVAVGALDDAVGGASAAPDGDGELLPDQGGAGHLPLAACCSSSAGGRVLGEGRSRGRVGAAVDGGFGGEVDGVQVDVVVPVRGVLEGDGSSAGLGKVVAPRRAAGGGRRRTVLLHLHSPPFVFLASPC